MSQSTTGRGLKVLLRTLFPPALCGYLPSLLLLRNIGETQKKQSFLRRGVKYARTIFTDSRIEYVFIALNGCKADSLRAGRTKGPSFCFFKQKITTYSIVIEAK